MNYSVLYDVVQDLVNKAGAQKRAGETEVSAALTRGAEVIWQTIPHRCERCGMGPENHSQEFYSYCGGDWVCPPLPQEEPAAIDAAEGKS